MAYRWLVVLALLVFNVPSFAGYANAVPPAGWAQSGSSHTFNFKAPSANAAVYSSNGFNTVRTTASLNVGGRLVTMPAAMRFAANAGGAVGRAAFLNPWWFLAGAVGVAAYDWFTANDYSVVTVDGVPKWVQRIEGIECLSNCFEYWSILVATPSPSAMVIAQQSMEIHKALQSPRNATRVFVTPSTGRASEWGYDYVLTQPCCGGVPAGYTGTYKSRLSSNAIPPYNTSSITDATADGMASDFQRIANDPAKGMPVRVPLNLPVDIPVELPRINPDPYPVGDPAPLFIPTGDPIPVANPQPGVDPYKQPGIRVAPSPTPDQPWRVDIQPQDKPVPNPDPLPLPVRDPFNPTGDPNDPLETPPDGSPNPNPDPVPNPNTPDPNKPGTEKQPSLCEQHPDILACQKINLGSTDATPIPGDTRNLAINKDTGWGPENGTCPSPKTASVMGLQLEMPFTALCDFADAFRPILIGLAWLSAAMTFFGVGRRE